MTIYFITKLYDSPLELWLLFELEGAKKGAKKRGPLIEAEWRIYASVDKTIIASDNGLSPIRRQAIVVLSIRPRGTHLNEILFEIQTFSFKKMHMKISSA